MTCGCGHVTALSSAEHVTCAIAADTTLWCWGRNTEGELGNPSAARLQRAPVQAQVPCP